MGRPVVRVNGAVLTDRDLLREMFAIFPYARLHNGFPKAMEADIRDGAMKMIIFEELVYQEAKRRNMTVPPARLARAMAEFRQQFHSPQEYQQFLQAEFQGSQKLLQAKVERSLLIDKLLKQEVTDKAVVSVAEAKAYFDQHPERFNTAGVLLVPEHFHSASAERDRRPVAGSTQARRQCAAPSQGHQKLRGVRAAGREDFRRRFPGDDGRPQGCGPLETAPAGGEGPAGDAARPGERHHRV